MDIRRTWRCKQGMTDSPVSQSVVGASPDPAGSNIPGCTTEETKKKKSLTSFGKVGIQIVMWRTYLARVVRMLYVRVSTLRTATMVLPCGSDVWTSSCNPVRSLPSCSITVFSTLSCWPAVWVASPAHQEDGIKEVAVLWMTDCEEASYSKLIYWPFLGFSFWRWASPPHRALCQPVTWPAAAAWREKSMMKMELKRILLPVLQQTLTATVAAVFVLTMAKWHCLSTSTSWSHTKKWKDWQMKTSLSETLWDITNIAVSVCTGSMSPSSLWMSWQNSINMFIGFVKAK